MISTLDTFLMDARPRTLTLARRGLLEFLYFGFKNARSCLFVGAFFATVLLVPRTGMFDIPRYDLLLIAAVAIQLAMVKSGLETWDELKAVCLFHVVGFALEAFKVSSSIQSWSYPDFAYTKIFGARLRARSAIAVSLALQEGDIIPDEPVREKTVTV